MKFGFALRRLSLTGPGKLPAEVVFTRGLNVIAGPSETGKSFIAQCVDYALGGGEEPKDIPEAEGYTTVLLEIESNPDHRTYKLERSLRGGEVRCTTEGQSDRILAAKHRGGKEDTVSQFLLDLSGLGSKKVRINEGGKTRPLSFRDIARLVIIDEETVIKKTSPVLSGQFAAKTAESGIFRLLLTGTDDSTVIANEDPKVTKGRQAGKAELLESLLMNARERLADLGDVGILTDERDRLARIEAALETAISERNAAQVSVAPLEAKRHGAWTALRVVDSKLAVMAELQTRFDLLQEQYSSDLRRLEAIAEAGVRLDQLKEERCPMCGALAEHHENGHREVRLSPTDVSQACKAESSKTFKLLQDLQATRAATAAETEQLRSVRAVRQQEFDAIAAELKALLERHVDVATKKVDELRAHESTSRKALELLERVLELEALLEEASTPKKKERAEGPSSAVSTAQADPFSREVEALLQAWHFPAAERVSFSEKAQDIVISGRARKSRGKGVRAITRAAFNLALLHLCVKDERPFPNFVLIDSPLIVYEEPDADEASFPQDVKKHFWESVKSSFAEAQVLIIENSKQLPNDGAIGDANVVLFTGNDQGRRGFIPQAGAAK
ncbi:MULTISPECIES: AAA family ATPase [Myxococcaceae]|uniref:AAA family ATPase n=1 Tax=Myxococcaceae TaxID=31 RepID=UPI001CBB375F|nr:AAA family ATPase [Corallococcus sp. AS-1-12]MBZ4402386.1 AAA family ATPase [Myxococcus sp. AS-1-15]